MGLLLLLLLLKDAQARIAPTKSVEIAAISEDIVTVSSA